MKSFVGLDFYCFTSLSNYNDEHIKYITLLQHKILFNYKYFLFSKLNLVLKY